MSDERGLSESVQWTVLTPLILMIVLGILQLGLWGYGRTVALNAAAAGAEEASPQSATTAQGADVARSIALAGGLSDLQVRVVLSGDDVVATVAGRMPGLIEVGVTKVEARVTRPKEQVTVP